MATLAALILAGGVNAALVSVEKLFALRIRSRVYMDVVTAGFFLVGPVTAFAWLPHPFGAAQPQPAWIKGAARVLLTPLGLLYALILFAYVGRIAFAARWPDGWVALPTLLFAAVGLAGYLIARTARDRDAERWAATSNLVASTLLLAMGGLWNSFQRLVSSANAFQQNTTEEEMAQLFPLFVEVGRLTNEEEESIMSYLATMPKPRLLVKIENRAVEEAARRKALETARRMREHGIAWDVVTDITGVKPEDLEAK